jgi:cation:H+ antiporter
MWALGLQFLAAALVIVVAGSFLTRFSDRIAALTGWGRAFVGGLLLAGATSLPELMVDLKAIELDLPDLAVGDLLGSSLFNLLILAVLDFAFPSAFRRTAFSPKFLHHALAAVLTILLTAIVGVGIVSDLNLSFLGLSVFAWALGPVYLYGLRLIFLEGQGVPPHAPATATENGAAGGWLRRYPLLAAFSGYLVSALVVALAAPYLVEAADGLARESGLGHSFVGTTLVALATSLPELAATLAAFRMGAPDLALGNVFGSNAFNMILFIPLDAMHPGSLFDSVKGLHALTAFGIVAATSVAVMGQLYRKKQRSRFSEPSSETVVVVIGIFLALLYWINLALRWPCNF